MKKLILLVAISLISFLIFAQNTTFSISAGATFPSFKQKEKSGNTTTTTTSDTRVGFTLGVLADVPISTNFIFQPGLLYTQKGGNIKETFGSSTFQVKNSFNYLEVPLNVLYNSPGSSGSFFIGTGPVLAYGISGKSTTSGTGQTETKVDVKFDGNKNPASTDQNQHLKAFEVAWDAVVGYKLVSGLTISALYNLGLSNIDPNGDNDNSVKNRYFGFKLGYALSHSEGAIKKK